MKMKPTILAGLLSLCASTSLWAQEAHAEYPKLLSKHVGESDLSYIANRCGGLSVAVLSVSKKGSNVGSQLKSVFEFYHTYAVLYLGDAQGLSRSDAIKSVRKSFKEFAGVYVEYLNASYVATGEYVTDPLVVDDLSTCSDIKNHLQDS